MKHQVVNLIIPVYERHPVFGLGLFLSEEGDHVVKMWDVSNGLFRVDILRFGLRLLQCPKCLQLAIIEATMTTEISEPNLFDVYSVEFGQGS